MTSQPTPPLKVPKAAATYTPATQDPDLRSQINTVLLRDGHVSKIQETLTTALSTSPQNWPTQIRTHALTLLRSGECTTFPALMSRVLDDIRRDTELQRRSDASGNINGNGIKAKVNGTASAAESLALPKTVVEEGVRVTRECLELVCEVDE